METKKLKYSFIVFFNHSEDLARSFLESLAMQVKNLKGEEAELIALYPSQNKFVKSLVDQILNTPEVKMKVKFMPYAKAEKIQALNNALKSAEGEYLIFSVDDVLLHHKYLDTFREVEKMPKPVVGGGKIIPFFDQEKPAWLAKWLLPLLEEINLGEEIKPFPKKLHPLLQNMFASQDLFKKTGGFNANPDIPEKMVLENFFSGLRQQNIPVLYFPNLMVWHFIPEEKLNRSYLRKIAEEKIWLDKQQARQKGRRYLMRLKLMELWKWIVTVLIAVYYFLTAQWSKIKSVFQYRYWHTKILFFG